MAAGPFSISSVYRELLPWLVATGPSKIRIWLPIQNSANETGSKKSFFSLYGDCAPARSEIV